MDALPLSKANLVNLEFTALGPLTPLRLLLTDRRRPPRANPSHETHSSEGGGISYGSDGSPVCLRHRAPGSSRADPTVRPQSAHGGPGGPQFALMMTLEKQGPCSQVDLGRRYALDKTTVSRNLKLLERSGWIESSIGIDRRKRQFVLTAAGREQLAIAKPKWKEAQNQLRSGMTDEQWDAMFRTFRAVTQTAQALM